MKSENIEIDVQINLQDYLKANYWFLFRKMRALFLLLFIPPLYIAMVIAQGKYKLDDNYWGLSAPWLILLVLMITTYFSTKRQLASNKSLNQEHHYIFSYDGIVITTSTSSSQTGWDIFREAFE